ncbi:MFS transporter [Tautonia plasticadhaerens]|uniref:Fosmidomycin resistance protein n=1 Tax=Tautonia plasticadhaerens TaxID=2527974 RepID=A0A518GWM8_9BACT|nr:MFS transporter [Tautonia plasticadhaerens]QDV32961.1 Fosmidomycin resistance protein [Tautonia plasticadhaerens]
MAIRATMGGGVVFLAALTMAHLVVDAFAASVHPLWPDLQDRLGGGPGMIQAAFLLWSLTTSASQLVFGYLGDRHRGEWMLWAGPMVGIACMGAVGLAGSLPALGGLLVLGGLGVAAFHPEAAAAAGQAMPDSRSRAMSLFATGGFLGQSLGPLGSGWLSEHRGLPSLAWNILWGIALVAMLLPWLRPASGASGGVRPSRGAALPELLRASGGRLGTLMGVGILRTLPAAGAPIALAFLLEARGVGNSRIGLVQSAFFGGIGLGGLACAALVSTRRERRVLWLLPMLAAPLLAACPVVVGAGMVAVSGALGLVVGLGLPVYISYGQQLVPEGPRVASSITMGVTWGLGGVLVAAIMAASDRLGQPDLAFGAFALASLLAGVACLRLPEPGRRPAPGTDPGPGPSPKPVPVGEAATRPPIPSPPALP